MEGEAGDVTQRRDLFVIGASAGSLEALVRLVSGLPKSLPAAICIVSHIGDRPSHLAKILTSRGETLPAVDARDGDQLQPGKIYVAPPNHHMLVKPDAIRVIMGPKEDFHRPAINPLFRSAAAAFGERVAGIILSGTRNDGVIGLKAIKRHGGLSIVQDPEEATFPELPLNAIRKDDVDFVLPTTEIAALLRRIAPDERKTAIEPPDAEVEADILELPVAQMKDTVFSSGQASGITCPECGGVLVKKTAEGMTQYRCHVGHAYSPMVMQQSRRHNTEASLWSAIRSLEENAMMLHALVDGGEADNTSKEELLRQAEESRHHAQVIRDILYRELRKGVKGSPPE